jgi:hypothetical protein
MIFLAVSRLAAIIRKGCVVDWGLVMRLVGAVLLIAGFGLCISIVWAAIGFIAMAFGLICLLIAEEKTNRARKLASSGALQTQAFRHRNPKR